MPVLDTQALIDNRVKAIRTYHQDTGIERAQLDVSGGVDSAVMLGLLAKAVGPENITAVYSGIHSSEDSRERARATCEAFGVSLIDIDLTEMFDDLRDAMHASLREAGFCFMKLLDHEESDPTVLGSIRSTLRAPIGRGFNRMTGGGIRHGTGNECEDRWLRFYQKGGDGEVDTNPIAMLSKGEVYQLAVALGVPESVLSAVPSPDLQGTGEAHNDEEELKELYGVDWTYSKVNLQGEYTSVGTIERISRYMDVGDLTGMISIHFLEKCFISYTTEAAMKMVESAAQIERATRHKLNPNCPTLGDRESLVNAGILTSKLPVI